MPSKKPKLQGVIEDELYEEFKTWRDTINAPSDSAALNSLLHQFFRGSPKPTGLGIEAETLEKLSTCVESIKSIEIPNISSDILNLTSRLNEQQETINYLLNQVKVLVPNISSDKGDNLNLEETLNTLNSSEISSDKGDNLSLEETLNTLNSSEISSDKGDNLSLEETLNTLNSSEISSDKGDNLSLEETLNTLNSSEISSDKGDNLSLEETLNTLNSSEISSDKGDNLNLEETLNTLNSSEISSDKGDNLNLEETLNTLNSSEISSDKGDTLDESSLKKTYNDALALIKEVVIIKALTQARAVKQLNEQGYPTASGKGEWTAMKVSNEIKKLKNPDG